MSNEKTAVNKTDRIRIKLRSYDCKMLDDSLKKIVETARRTGATITGPMIVSTIVARNFYLCEFYFVSTLSHLVFHDNYRTCSSTNPDV